jgi:hypothetical protein
MEHPIPIGDRNAHLESLSHFFDGLIADQQRFAVRCDVEEGVAVDFALDLVDLRALKLQAGQRGSTGSIEWDEHFTVKAPGDDGRKGMGSDFEEGERPILNDLMWPQDTA